MAMLPVGNLPLLFKGAGPGTHWHSNDPQLGGYTSANLPASLNRLLAHVVSYSFPSPYISFTTSFAIAREYALSGPGGLASADRPGFVYEVDLSALAVPPTVVDPVAEIADPVHRRLAHDHNGAGALIAQIASRSTALTAAPQNGGNSRLPNVSNELLALIFAIRDAEVLVHGGLLAGAVVNRHSVF
jgi:hypothetical protein